MTGPEMKALRKVAGLKQAGMADLMGVTVMTISRWETGAMTIEPRTAFAARWIAQECAAGRRP